METDTLNGYVIPFQTAGKIVTLAAEHFPSVETHAIGHLAVRAVVYVVFVFVPFIGDA